MSDIPQKVKEAIEKGDRLVSLFNMKIGPLEEGKSVVSMRIGKQHLNAAGVCHGGVIFSLSDVAFALASNSYGTIALALEMSVSYTRAVMAGQTLTARCNEQYRGRRTATYLIEVTNEKGELVALLKGTVFRKDESLI